MTYYYEVAPNHIARAGDAVFTYSSEQQLKPGHIVSIPLGKKHVIGLVIRAVDKPTFATKSIEQLLENTPLPPPLVALAQWLSDYYQTPLATTLQTVLPAGLTKKRREKPISPQEKVRDRTNFVFNNDQRAAIEQLSAMPSGTAILRGVTGSGKTAVYIELARQAIAAGRSVIILVPEIALTSQLVDEFTHAFGDRVLMTHSRQTEAQRHSTWQRALAADTPLVVVGPRSALFMPLRSVGLIVIDEAHEPSYKQEQSPRYSALRAASVLGSKHNARVIFGSATPSVSDYYLAEQTGRPIVIMPRPAVADTTPPVVELVDMTKHNSFKRHRFFSDALLDRLETTFAAGHQALIFHNRRGSTSTTLCENCGWIAGCPRCFIPLTLHADAHQLRCHICNYTARVPTTCPECGHVDIIHKGIGTKLIESELRRLFPDKHIARFDADTTKDNAVDTRYKDLYDGTIDIIIGTQVIAKGLDLPNLRTVGVVQADAGLSLPDFGAGERTFQLLAQVIGRVGRSHHPTNVIIQTYQPHHPSVTYGTTQDYPAFYEFTVKERRRAHFPPFTYLLKLTGSYKTEAAAIRNAQALAGTLRAAAASDITILGPTPSFYELLRDHYRWQLVIKSPTRKHLVDLLAHLPPTHWQADLDPVSLL